jgi:DNA-binding XRE family transcriptional regulator
MSRRNTRVSRITFPTVELAGVAYAMVPLTVMTAVCRQAGVAAVPLGSSPPAALDVGVPEALDGTGLARRLADRRKHAGMTQGELARRAGVRIETVNRIERGHVTPDFGTIRKLVQAMLHAEISAAQPRGRRTRE